MDALRITTDRLCSEYVLQLVRRGGGAIRRHVADLLLGWCRRHGDRGGREGGLVVVGIGPGAVLDGAVQWPRLSGAVSA
jgi:hypothetical protein